LSPYWIRGFYGEGRVTRVIEAGCSRTNVTGKSRRASKLWGGGLAVRSHLGVGKKERILPAKRLRVSEGKGGLKRVTTLKSSRQQINKRLEGEDLQRRQ